MNGDTLWQTATDCAEVLPGSTLEYPYGPDAQVWMVRKKSFMILGKLHGKNMVTLKAAPDDVLMLRNEYPEIMDGYHMNKKHWFSAYPGEKLTPEELEDLVTESYLLVVEKLPKKDRPINPKKYGK